MRKRTFLITVALCCVYSVAAAFVLEASVAQVPETARGVEDHTVAPQPRNRRAVATNSLQMRRLTARIEEQKSRAGARTAFVAPKKMRTPGNAVVATAAPPSSPQRDTSPLPLLSVIEKADIEIRHKRIASEVLMAFPEQCRDTLENFYVRYEKPENRGLAGKSVMILDGTVPDEEFRALFVHESGHNFDLGCFAGTKISGESAFRDGNEPMYENDPSVRFYQISWITSSAQRSDANPEDFVSGYASYDAFEDFAESFAYYVLQNETFEERASGNRALAAKYRWFQETFGADLHIATGRAAWDGTVPWDVTKLPYEWHPELAVANR